MRREQDQAKAKEMLSHIQQSVFPVFFDKLEKRVAKNGLSVCKSVRILMFLLFRRSE